MIVWPIVNAEVWDIGRPMPRQAIDRAALQSVDDVVVEPAGNQREAQTFGVVIAFKRAGHSGRAL